MKIIETPLNGVLIFEPRCFGDKRGYFIESFRRSVVDRAGITYDFVQANTSRSAKGVLRGLHYQTRRPQGKLVRVSRGSVYDVAVDIRENSPTYGLYFGIELNDENHRQLWVPPGLAHGFCTLSDSADFHYMCTEYYDPDGEGGIVYNDHVLNIKWPVQSPVISEKDRLLPPFGAHKPCTVG